MTDRTDTPRLGHNGVAHIITGATTDNYHGTERLETACGSWFADRVAVYFPHSDHTPTHTDCADCTRAVK